MTLEHRRDCGCVASVEEDGRKVLFRACSNEEHLERLGLFWRVIARVQGQIYEYESGDGPCGMAFPCGCRWDIVQRTFIVRPCDVEGHHETLIDAARLAAREQGKPLHIGVEFEA